MVESAPKMDLDNKTYVELVNLCKNLKITHYSGKKKAELKELVKKASTPKEKQDSGKFRINTKDQFYTSAAVAKECVGAILEHVSGAIHYRWIEPSAGAGAFLAHVPAGVEVYAVDIEPTGPGIVKADYLAWAPPAVAEGKKTLVFGNPPFGRQASTAKAFIAKSCEFATVIAFILPLSFTKPSMARAFASHYHLIHELRLGADAFLLNGEHYDVPCVFQIWERRAEERPVTAQAQPCGFTYVKPGEAYTFALRRVGVYAGRCYPVDGTSYSAQSHYFIKVDPEKNLGVEAVERILRMMNEHEFPSNTVGPRSLSKGEVNVVLNEVLEKVTSSP